MLIGRRTATISATVATAFAAISAAAAFTAAIAAASATVAAAFAVRAVAAAFALGIVLVVGIGIVLRLGDLQGLLRQRPGRRGRIAARGQGQNEARRRRSAQQFHVAIQISVRE